MPPKRSTRAAAAAAATRSTAATSTATRTTAPDAAAPPSAAASASKTVLAHRRTKPLARTTRPHTDGANDDEDASDSGNDSDALAISSRPARLFRNRNREQQTRPEEYVMTGGLGEARGGRVARTKKKKVGAGKEQAQALEGLRRRREEAMKGNAAVEDDAEKEKAPEDAGDARGRRRESSLPPVPGTASRVRRASSSHWNAPPSAVKAQGTPAAGETSVLALSMFKRRKRQPSLLRMMQQSDVEDGGDGSEEDSALTLDYSLGDFEPDHESTPLNLKKGSTALGSEPRTSSSRKRKLAERETEEVQVPRSSPPVEEQGEPSRVRATSSEHLYSEASDLPQVVADTQPEPEEEEAEGDTAATAVVVSDTRSSTSILSSVIAEPEPEPEEAPAKRPRRSVRESVTYSGRSTRQKAKNIEEDHTADPLSSDSDSDTATDTPVRTRITRKKAPARKMKAMSLSTATLQSLLPRRRKKLAPRTAKAAANTFEIPSSDVEDEEEVAEEESADEDELHSTPPPTTKRKGRKTASAAPKASDSTVRGKKIAGAALPEKGKGKRLSRTYGRNQRMSSDKENQDGNASIYVDNGGEESDGDEDVVETSEMREAAIKSKELDAAARKFREVDEWEMEFESVDMGGASASSPWR
ncbi:hypothetical protein GTA08_BOTSDO08643 [Botryosphaeria dothidea]|uniref:Uncharacterized protein n=1 Tax=Botryosphaeria dothidea TaxID=55169 RepID=A0A8H4IMJ6_9PEZI|nr:hypothetical protein GTA08_BOTSDO08643 [Botryosphaeria dothidea]